MNYLILNINYFFNIFIFFSFVVSFKKIPRTVLLKIIIISILISTMITYVLFRYLLIKDLFLIITVTLTSYFLLNKNIKDVIIKFLIFLSVNFISELLVGPLYANFMQDGIFHMLWWAHILLSVCLNISLFIMLKGHLYFIKSFAFLKKDYFISFCVLLSLIMISSLLGTLFSMDLIHYYEHFDFVPIVFIVFLFILWIILLITLIIIFIRQYHDEKMRLMLSELPNTYQQLLEEISLKDQQDYTRLKHDILNYIQIYKTIDDERKEQ